LLVTVNNRLKFEIEIVHVLSCHPICGQRLKVRQQVNLQTACGNFTEFTTYVQLGTKMNWLHFEVKRSKVKVTLRPCMIESSFS